MKRRAFSLCDVADRNGCEEIRLALDCRGGLARLEIGGRRSAAEIVGERHEGAAMHDAETVIEVVTRNELRGDPLGRNMCDLEAEQFGKWRLLAGRFVHSMLPAHENDKGADVIVRALGAQCRLR